MDPVFSNSRAKSNQATTETTTEVIFAEPPVINVTESGVIENTTEKIKIQCQGSGKPRPTFQLNLFYDYGPDLIKTGLYQVKADFLFLSSTCNPSVIKYSSLTRLNLPHCIYEGEYSV